MNDLELLVLLPLPPKYWGGRHAQPSLAYPLLGVAPKALFIADKWII